MEGGALGRFWGSRRGRKVRSRPAAALSCRLGGSCANQKRKLLGAEGLGARSGVLAAVATWRLILCSADARGAAFVSAGLQ